MFLPPSLAVPLVGRGSPTLDTVIPEAQETHHAASAWEGSYLQALDPQVPEMVRGWDLLAAVGGPVHIRCPGPGTVQLCGFPVPLLRSPALRPAVLLTGT